MADGSVVIGATVRAGVSDLGPSVRACWAALLVACAVSLVASLAVDNSALALLLKIAAAVLAYGALYRRAFGRQAGVAGLRWGMEEWRLLGAQALIGLLFLVVASVLFVVVGGVALGVARANAPGFDPTSSDAWRAALGEAGFGTFIAGLAPLASLTLLIWLGARLSLAAPASVDQSGVRVLSAFPLTRGVVLPLVASAVALAAPVIALVALSALVGRWAGPAIDGLLAALGAAFVYFYLAPVWTGALVHVYRRRWTPEAPAARDAA